MTSKNVFRQFAIVACPWVALSAPSVLLAQSPTLAEPAPSSDLSYLLDSAVDQQAGVPQRVTEKPAVARRADQQPGLNFSPAPAAESSPLVTPEEDIPRSSPLQPTIQSPAPEPQYDEEGGESKVEVIRERYPNRRVRIERHVTQDSVGNYLNHGSWKMWDERGNLMAEGQNDEGLRQGVWNRWHGRNESPLFTQYPYKQFTPPFISQAEFRDGQLHGLWTIYDAKQNKISQWKFDKGQREGLSMWWHPNGKKLREITYKQGAIDGEVVEFTDAGAVASRAVFQKGRQLALRTERHSDGGVKTQGMYLHAPMVVKTPDDWWNALPAVFTHVGKDERHGDWVTLYPTGQEQLRGRYQNDLEDGTFTWWYPNGQKSAEGVYELGRQQGNWIWWHKNGQKATEGSYKGGEQIGRWTMWNEQGRVTQASEHAGGSHSTVEADELPTPTEESPNLRPSPQELSQPEPATHPAIQETASAPRLLAPPRR